MSDSDSIKGEMEHPWPYLRSMFKLKAVDGRSFVFTCLLCTPKITECRSFANSPSNLKKHVERIHPEMLSTYEQLSYASRKRKRFGDFPEKARNGCLDCFKRRHNTTKGHISSETPCYVSIENDMKSEDIDMHLDLTETSSDGNIKTKEDDRNAVNNETMEESVKNIRNSNENTRSEESNIGNVSSSIISHKEAWEMTCKLLLYAHVNDETDEMTRALLEFQNLLWKEKLKDKSRNA